MTGKFSSVYEYGGSADYEQKENEYLRLLEDSRLFVFADHGSSTGWGAEDLLSKEIKPSFVVSYSCENCGYDKVGKKGELLCMRMLRNGALVYVGAVDVIPINGNYLIFIKRFFGEGWSLGASMLYSRTLYETPGDSCNTVILLGDPTLTAEDIGL